MPIKFFMKFFQNHGLFNLRKRPQWYTVKNRSRQYVNKVIEKISGEHFKNYKIEKIKRISNFVQFFMVQKMNILITIKLLLLLMLMKQKNDRGQI